MQKTIFLRLLLATMAVSLVLVMAEILLHFFYPIRYRMPPEKLPSDAWRQLLHRPSPIPGLAYELAPNRDIRSHGARIRTNSFGMRDDEPRPASDTSVHRIAVLGDSFTFGFGVPGRATYPNVLEQLLSRGIGGARFEVLNFGVGGYSTRDEALLLRHKAIAWDLDLVIVGYYFNDPETDPLQPLHSHFQKASWWQYSNLLRLVSRAKRRWDVERYGDGNYYRYLHATNRRRWQSVVSSLREISAVAAKKNIPALLVIFPDVRNGRSWSDYPYHDLRRQVTETANEEGIHVVDLHDTFSHYSNRALMVSPDDNHPSKLGHRLAAGAIYQWIEANEEELRFPWSEDHRAVTRVSR